ncbi:MAG: peptidylprolyl isomerase [Elusimicrobia bacterium]|nr:peptidylprolyl isomerase [Elusimicrobiota bacterium]
MAPMRAPPSPVWLTLLPLLLIPACGKKEPVLARVGSHTVTTGAFLKEVEGVPFTSQAYLRSPAGRKELLELLVRRKIILQEAETAPADPEDKKILDELAAQYKERRKQLRESFQEETERAKVGRFTKKLKDGPLKVTDNEVRAFWETEKEVRASHILVSNRALAEDIRKRITAGEKFEALAKAHSEDAGSAAKGGDAGFLLRGSLVPDFENALFQMKTGETSGVVVSPYGFHIIRRGEDRPLSRQPLSDALKARIRQTLEGRKLQEWFDQIRKRHPVKIDTEKLNDVVFPTPSVQPETRAS